MRKSVKWLGLFASAASALVFLTSCGPEQTGGTSSYKDEKTMVIDILKSDEGKKAINAAMNGESEDSGSDGSSGGGADSSSGGQGGGGSKGKMRTLSTADSKELKMIVKEVLTNPENSKFLESMLKDPKFAGEFAKAIQKQTKQLYIDLMKDPDYQKELLGVMKNQEFETILMDAMKTTKSRQQMKMVVQDTLQNPLFKAELVTLLKKAVEEHLQEPEKKKQKEHGKEQGSEKSKDQGSEGGRQGGDQGGGEGGQE